MGASLSLSIELPSRFGYFMLTFGDTDKLRLILAPEIIISTTQNILNTMWHIQNVSKSNGFVEFKIRGNPWSTRNEGDVSVKYFLCCLLKEYQTFGWHLKVSTNLHRTGFNPSVLYFELKSPSNSDILSVGLNGDDRIRIVATTNNLPDFQSMISKYWPLGIQRERLLNQSLEFKLKGRPWNPSFMNSEDSYYGIYLLNETFTMLYRNGWKFFSSIRHSRYQENMGSYYFAHDPPTVEKFEYEIQAKFFAMSLASNDLLRFVNLPESLRDEIKHNLEEAWEQGIQEERYLNQTYEIKFRGNPWLSNGKDAIDSKEIIRSLILLLNRYNWNIYAIGEVTPQLSGTSTFIFKWEPEPAAFIKNVVVITFNESDKLRVLHGDEQIISNIRESILKNKLIDIQSESMYFNAWEFKLRGNPFTTSFHQSKTECLVTIFNTFVGLEYLGLKFICSADLSSKYHSDDDDRYPIGCNTWFFAT